MFDVSHLPKVRQRLKFGKIDCRDNSTTPYWAAVAISADFSDKHLARFKGFDFSDRSYENGMALLSRIEEFLNRPQARERKGRK